jgi:two-component system, NarL family, response regulator
MEKQSKKAIRILIVDDHPVVRAGLSDMLSTQQGMEVAGATADGEEALALIAAHHPDVLLLDLRMPGMSGIELLSRLKASHSSVRAIVLTSFDGDEDIYRAVKAGAEGYLLKSTTQAEMVQAIQSVHAGNRHIPLHIAGRLAQRMMRSSLTPRELEVLAMLAKGLTNKEIGRALQISQNTAHNHINSILEKLEVTGRTEAATLAIQQGIIHVD